MGIEDVEKNGSGTITGLTRYGLGACEIEPGIDVVSRTTSSGNTVSYPLYDAHGNNVGGLSKSGSSFVVSDEKSYDAWGGLRSGTNANGKAAYCANLGHKQDDESGLIYMRARYYEPTSGRFVSEDNQRDGKNWVTYCCNNPINLIDESGNSPIDDLQVQGVALFLAIQAWAAVLVGCAKSSMMGSAVAIIGLAFCLNWMTCDYSGRGIGVEFKEGYKGMVIATLVMAVGISQNYIAGGFSAAKEAVGALAAHAATIGLFLAIISFEEAYEKL